MFFVESEMNENNIPSSEIDPLFTNTCIQQYKYKSTYYYGNNFNIHLFIFDQNFLHFFLSFDFSVLRIV